MTSDDLAQADRAVDTVRDGFPGDPAGGDLSGDRREEDDFFDRHGALPYPALDPVTGTCDLYELRPIICRTYGPPVRFGGQSLPPLPALHRRSGAGGRRAVPHGAR